MSNKDLIAMLEEFAKIYDILGDVYKSKAYTVAVSTIAKHKQKLTASNLDHFLESRPPGIGKGITSRIKEYVTTGKVEDLQELKKSREYTTYCEFTKIIGVGPATVRKWVEMGVDSLLKLRQAIAKGTIELTHAQKLGLIYYADLNQRVPRAEVAAIGAKIKSYINRIAIDNKFEIVGSYRRGAESSGDIDCVFTTEKRIPDIIDKLTQYLQTDTNYVDTLSQGDTKITFLYRGKSTIRQVDVFYALKDQYIPHLLYATGSAEHNERIRGIAKSQGYRLNQLGLFKITTKGMKKITLYTERQLYDILKIPYAEPKDRLN
jgi:DNA polymerase/3'-5' exonuclease PolX